MAWVMLLDIAKISSWYEDRGIAAEHEGKLYVVFKKDNSYYVLDDICSHEYARLSEGEVWGEQVYCPKHGSSFNIKTGAVRGLPATKPVKSYPVKIENNCIFIDIE